MRACIRLYSVITNEGSNVNLNKSNRSTQSHKTITYTFTSNNDQSKNEFYIHAINNLRPQNSQRAISTIHTAVVSFISDIASKANDSPKHTFKIPLGQQDIECPFSFYSF